MPKLGTNLDRKGTTSSYVQIFAIANFAMGFPVSMHTAAVHEMCLKLVFYVMLSHPLLCLCVIPHHSQNILGNVEMIC